MANLGGDTESYRDANQRSSQANPQLNAVTDSMNVQSTVSAESRPAASEISKGVRTATSPDRGQGEPSAHVMQKVGHRWRVAPVLNTVDSWRRGTSILTLRRPSPPIRRPSLSEG
jgi:hypothetical protein